MVASVGRLGWCTGSRRREELDSRRSDGSWGPNNHVVTYLALNLRKRRVWELARMDCENVVN